MLLPLGLLLAASACDRKDSGKEKVPAASAAPAAPKPSSESGVGAPKPGEENLPPVARGASLPASHVLGVVNPEHRPAYEGPTGRVRGHVTVSGDPPSEMPIAEIPAKCPGARETFRSAFREGMQRRLADVLVAVTGYQGYVPPTSDAVVLEGRDCAWTTRTVAITYGQRIDVVSKDQNTYVPELLGQPWPVQLLATPGGDPVSVPPREIGHYVLIDAMRLYNKADVYVLAYPTFDVTGLDGTFEIDRIPPGKVKVNALLPITGAIAEESVTVEAGKTTNVELTIRFDGEAFDALADERAENEAKLRSRKASP